MKVEQLRMVQWLLMGLGFYLTAHFCTNTEVQLIAAKLGNATIASYMGYKAYNHIEQRRSGDAMTDMQRLARALIVLAFVIAVGLGA